MSELIHLREDLKTTQKMLRAIMRSVATTRRLQDRMSNLKLFGDDRSQADEKDHPLVQLMLEHAKIYSELKPEFDAAEDPRAKERTARLIGDHLREMGSMTVAVQKDIHGQVGTMAKLVADAAKIANIAQIHTERLELAKKMDPSNLTDAELADVIGDADAGDAPEG